MGERDSLFSIIDNHQRAVTEAVVNVNELNYENSILCCSQDVNDTENGISYQQYVYVLERGRERKRVGGSMNELIFLLPPH